MKIHAAFRRPADNPFASRRIEALSYRSKVFSWSRLDDRLALHGGRGAVVGPKGNAQFHVVAPLLWVRNSHTGIITNGSFLGMPLTELFESTQNVSQNKTAFYSFSTKSWLRQAG